MKTLFEGKKLYAILIVSAFVIASIVIHNSYQQALRDAIKGNRLKAAFLSSLIYEHQNAAIGLLDSYSRRLLFIDAVGKKDFDFTLPHLQSLKNNNTEIDALFVTDKNGTLWANYPVDSTGFGKNLAYRDWYKGLSKDWKPYISSIYQLIVLEKGLAVAVSVPVFDRRGNVIGTLGAAQRIPFFASFIKANMADYNDTITLLDQKGNIIFSNALSHENRITKYPDAQVLKKALAGNLADLEIADAKDNGAIEYVSVAPVKRLGWSIIVGRERAAILKPLYGYFIFCAFAGIGIFILVSVILLFFRREYTYRKTKELLQAEEKFVKTFRANPVCVGLSRLRDGLVLEANEAMLKTLGYSEDEFVGHAVLELDVWNDLADRDRVLQNLTTKGRSMDQEYWLRTKTGELLLCNHSAELIQLNNEPHVIFTFFDVTERRQIEDALKVSEERLRFALETIHTGAWDLDLIDHTAFRSIEHDRIFGYSQLLPEWTYEMFLEHVYPEDRAMVDGKYRQAMDNKSDWSFECRINRIDGQVRWILAAGRHTQDAAGNPHRMAGIVQDITERKHAEDLLLLNMRKLEEINNDLESFSYSVSHDLRAPLRAIDGYSRMILKKRRDSFDEELKRQFQVIRDNVEKMGKLIDDLLAFSRLGRQKVTKVNLDMDELIKEIWGELVTINSNRFMTLKMEPMPASMGDRSLIRQVYSNLLENAIKFTRTRESVLIEVGCFMKDHEQVYFLRDNGIGFDMKFYDKIFGVFQRLHSDAEYEGTGIGLALVQRIIHRHGGRIWAEAELDKGATFYFSLPSDSQNDNAA